MASVGRGKVGAKAVSPEAGEGSEDPKGTWPLPACAAAPAGGKSSGFNKPIIASAATFGVEKPCATGIWSGAFGGKLMKKIIGLFLMFGLAASLLCSCKTPTPTPKPKTAPAMEKPPVVGSTAGNSPAANRPAAQPAIAQPAPAQSITTQTATAQSTATQPTAAPSTTAPASAGPGNTQPVQSSNPVAGKDVFLLLFFIGLSLAALVRDTIEENRRTQEAGQETPRTAESHPPATR
jgi:hypothetical protein